jgi:preprotein translocase subunit SecG
MARNNLNKFNKSNISYLVWMVLVLVTIMLLIYIIMGIINNNNKKDRDIEDRDNKDNKDTNKICLSLPEYQKLLLQKQQPQQVQIQPQSQLQQTQQQSSVRDYRVLNDQLYPPLNRTDIQTHRAVATNIENRNMYVPTRDIKDNYRLVGYVINNNEDEKDAGGNKWKLIAREKDRNTADFYMIPSDSRYDIKVAITDNMILNDRLRDIYTIPNSITFNSPLLNKTPYDFVEIPKTDYTSNYI